MIKTSAKKFRLRVPEALEDRAVPSTLGVGSATTSRTTTPTVPTNLQAEF
jgi:hypothetical protein